MKILIQRDTVIPEPWQEMSSDQWDALPPGLKIQALNIQGVIFSGYDFIAVEHINADTCKVTVWKESVAPEERIALEWTFNKLRPDPKLGNAYNTDQQQVVYAGSAVLARYDTYGSGLNGGIENTTFHNWDAFFPPIVKRRVLAAPSDTHAAAREIRGWREWTDGVPQNMLTARGEVRDQRALGLYNKPRGTRTYYMSSATETNGIHSTDANGNNKALSTTFSGSSATQATANFTGGASRLTHQYTTPSGEPDHAQWPAGEYRVQLDCTATGSGMSYGCTTAGSVEGHLARVNSGLTADLETKDAGTTTPTTLASGTGLKLLSTGSITWSSGNASDRFEVLVAGVRASSGGSQTFTLRVNLEDDFADGPWSGAVFPIEINVNDTLTTSEFIQIQRTLFLPPGGPGEYVCIVMVTQGVVVPFLIQTGDRVGNK